MKKLIFICFFLIVLRGDNIAQKYLNYTNNIINYSFVLKHFKEIKNPFKEKTVSNNKVVNNKAFVKIIKLNLLSILNDNSYFNIKEYLGSQLIKSYNRWFKKGQKVSNCVIYQVFNDKVILKCNGKKLIKTLNKKILDIKEKQ